MPFTPGVLNGENVMYGRNLVYGTDKGPRFSSGTHTVLITPTLRSFDPLVFINAPFYWFLVFPTPETVRGIVFGITWDDKRYL